MMEQPRGRHASRWWGGHWGPLGATGGHWGPAGGSVVAHAPVAVAHAHERGVQAVAVGHVAVADDRHVGDAETVAEAVPKAVASVEEGLRLGGQGNQKDEENKLLHDDHGERPGHTTGYDCLR